QRQLLGQNQTSGPRRSPAQAGHARVRLSRGLVAEVQAEGVTGIKALFRLLSWRDGGFAFAPTDPGQPGDIQRPVGELLLEGLRQADEIPALRARLPGATLRLRLAPGQAPLADESHPVTAEVVTFAMAGLSLAEMLERSKATDFAVLKSLAALVEGGRVATSPRSAEQLESRLLLPPAAIHALKATLARGEPVGGEGAGRLLVGWFDASPLGAWLRALAAVQGFRSEPSTASAVGLGTVGQLELAEDLTLDRVALPGQSPARPVWGPLGAGAIGALLLAPPKPEPALGELATLAVRELGAVVVVSGRASVPEDGLPAEAIAVPGGGVDALRELLLRAARPAARPQPAPTKAGA
ncbi:MAG: DUF4388 domain-containing protein, partial [Deltaproteobacteria bacterium]